jgi:hypothetical protein
MPLWVHKAGREARHGCVDVWHDDSCRPGPWATRRSGPDGRSVVSQCNLSGAAERGLADCLSLCILSPLSAACPSANHRATPIAQAHTPALLLLLLLLLLLPLLLMPVASGPAAVQPAVASLLHSAP